MNLCAFFPFHSDAVPVSTILTSELPTLKAKIEEESLKTPDKSKEDYAAEVANLKLYIKRIEDKHAEEITKKDNLIEHVQKHNGSLRGENDRLKKLIRIRNKQLEKLGVANVTKKKKDEIVTKITKKKQDKIVTKEVLNSYDMNTDIFPPDPLKVEPTDEKGAKKGIKLSKNDRQNVPSSKEIHKNQISNEEFLDPNRISIKEQPMDENCDVNTDVFLPDPVKIEPTDKGAKKKIKLSKIDSQNVSNSNEIHKNQISNEEFLDPNRIDIKEDPLDENYDMNTDVFLPDPVKIEPTDENFYDYYDDDPLAS